MGKDRKVHLSYCASAYNRVKANQPLQDPFITMPVGVVAKYCNKCVCLSASTSTEPDQTSIRCSEKRCERPYYQVAKCKMLSNNIFETDV